MRQEVKRRIRDGAGHKGRVTKIVVLLGHESPRVKGRRGYTGRFYDGVWHAEGRYFPSTRRIEVGDVWVAAFAGDASFLYQSLEVPRDMPLGIAADYAEDNDLLNEEELAVLRAGLALTLREEGASCRRE